MRGDGGETNSCWPSTGGVPTDGILHENITTNTCIVGAGVVGLSIAYELMRQGHNVVVLDDGPIGGGESGRAAGIVGSALTRFSDLEALGPRMAKETARLHARALEWFEAVVRRERLPVDWKRVPSYVSGASDQLEREEAAARRAGVGPSLTDSPLGDGRALVVPDQGRLEPTAFLRALTGILRGGGVRIHTQTHVDRLEDGGRAVVTSAGRVVQCHHVVEATNAPVFGHAHVFAKQVPYRHYLLSGRSKALPDAVYWDMDDLGSFARMRAEGMVVGGHVHRTGHPPEDHESFGPLQAAAHDRYGLTDVTHRWSGQTWRPLDGLPLIGRSENSIIATGDSGTWSHAAMAALMVTGIITGQPDAQQDLVDPQRRVVGRRGRWFKENNQLGASLSRVLMPGQVREFEEVLPGQAAIVRRGLRLYACYRDPGGTLHRRLAVCNHMGCIVEWNGTEKSWDCPCHGSRYTGEGTVVNGPANHDLGEEEPLHDGVRGAREEPLEPEQEEDEGGPDPWVGWTSSRGR